MSLKDMKWCVRHDGSWRRINKDLATMNHASEKSKRESWRVKDSQPHTGTCAQPSIDLACANFYCSQVKPSCDEHVLVEICDSFITSENDEFKRENEMLKMELSLLKGKGHV
jgi:hypothetical protein